ncbi:endocuticle structural glycoprotein SgAbd-4-like [Euwallacea fornicatus]|uniref:endocuticle structural glycoprotein SgAbd-4-like n=1 Tax=Euwallacea fornicatus TaxID=995702 RepID=UPI00339005FB
MLFKFSFLALAAFAYSAPPNEPVSILSQSSDVQPNGTFQWGFETADGTKQDQQGVLKPAENGTVEVLQGAAAWSDPEGGKHELVYVADENGYQPQGSDIPVSPKIPAPIARALEWIAAHPQSENQEKR